MRSRGSTLDSEDHATVVWTAGGSAGTLVAVIQGATRLIVVETPARHSADIPGKNESATAVAISPALGASATDEASTAAAVSPSSGTDPRGSKAASAGDAQSELRSDPHGTASLLRNP